MERDLTKGSIARTMLLFALPMMLGNLLQQVYNIADTIIVGRFIDANALAAVGSAYTLMTFLTSVILGLCMGCGALFSTYYGAGKMDQLKESIWVSFWLILFVTVVIYFVVFSATDGILRLLQVPEEVYSSMYTYVRIIFFGIGFTFFYNFFAFVMRSAGDSVTPLVFLTLSTILNIILDLWFVIGLRMGVGGAAAATVTAQGVAGIGIALTALIKMPLLRIGKQHRIIRREMVAQVGNYACLTCLQQSTMNFGILMIQGLVNSFGATIMAAFAVAVKIDTLAYMPLQEFGNAFSLFISQNHGAEKKTVCGRVFESLSASRSYLASWSPSSYGFLRVNSCLCLSAQKKSPSSPPVCATCALRARSTGESAVYSSSTACTAQSESPPCLWC